jgi:hypothetical protein
MATVRNTGLRTLCALFLAAPGVVYPTQAVDWLGPERIGASFQEISVHVALTCGGESIRLACTASAPGEVFDGIPVQRIEAMFQDAQLARGRVMFADTHYEALLRALTGRYGPGEDRSFVANAGMAGYFPAGVFVWTSGAVNLVLEQYAGKIDRSSLTYGTHSSMAGLLQKIRAYPRGARRDL